MQRCNELQLKVLRLITVRIKSNPYQSQITDIVTARTKAWVCGRLLAGIAVYNSAGDMGICPL